MRTSRLARRARLLTSLLSLGLLLTVLAGCAVNPVTGKREIILMSESQERELGAESDRAIVGQYGLVDDASLTAYIEGIGRELASRSHRRDMTFTFRLLDDPVVNAFALPGGYVYLTRGILAYLTDEGAMAGVLGHEVGHVTARHSAKRYTKQQILGVGLGIGSLLSEEFAKYAGYAGAAGQLLLLKYSRDNESQSDELGVTYATASGYDTRGMADFFGALARLTGGGPGLPSWASTHPDPGDRKKKVRALTRAEQAKTSGSDFAVNRDGYLRRLEGLAFGADPRQGFVDNGLFKHPDMEFQFTVPQGWKVMNTAAQVQLADPDGAAAVLFSVDGSSQSARDAAGRFEQEAGVRIVERRDQRIGGFVAHRMLSETTTKDGTLNIVSTFISKTRTVYVFHGLATAAAFGTKRRTLESVADGFATLTDRDALAIQPITLHITAIERDGPFRQVVTRWPIPDRADLDVEGLALLNGVEPDARMTRGTLIKVLRTAR